MRGKAASVTGRCTGAGITPAYAGKSRLCHQGTAGSWDHPRVCGEKGLLLYWLTPLLGSPPRMRGKEKSTKPFPHRFGITPAYAGKSAGLSGFPWSSRDHPRVCGEKTEQNRNSCASWGSPPRMRGKDVENLFLSSTMGITPAYAGKRLKRSRSTVPPVAIVPLFPSVCNKPVVSDGSPAGRDAPLFLPAENAVPASPAYNLRSL